MIDSACQLQFVAVTSLALINRVAYLAQQIWITYYPPITDSGQTHYMLENYQSITAITQQLQAGYHYFLVKLGTEGIGYFAVVYHPSSSSVQLSKIYLAESARRHGYGAAIMRFVAQWSLGQGAGELWLTVNRNNLIALSFYHKVGFSVTGPLLQAIGNGYVMDDYRMAKPILQRGNTT